jgi:hypothetical protein
MYLIAVGLVLLGVLCGAMLRLIPFVIVLFMAVAIAAISTPLREHGSVLNAVIALLALQIGYAGGILTRAVLRWGRKHGRASPAGEAAPKLGAPPGKSGPENAGARHTATPSHHP